MLQLSNQVRVTDKLSSATAADIEQWSDALLTASSVHAIFNDLAHEISSYVQLKFLVGIVFPNYPDASAKFILP
jgi:hypothetical protein